MEERNPVPTSDFLEETIKSRPRNTKHIMRRMIEVALLAVLFGIIACITMTIVAPWLEEKLFPLPSNEVSFTEESPQYTPEEIQPEDMLLEDIVEEPEPIVIEVTEEKTPEEILMGVFAMLKEKVKACKSWMTTVSGISKETSWLESTSTSANNATGAIIADNGTELLILVERSCIADSDDIFVTFVDGNVAEGYKKGEDLDADLAVVAVTKEQLHEKTLTSCSIVEMSDSNTHNLLGSLAFILGNFNGVTGNSAYGFITAVGIDVISWDTNYKLILTDHYGNTEQNGFLVNMKGQLIGVLCNDYNSEDTKNLTAALGIGELKKKIERMSNGKAIPSLGVKGVDVTEWVHEQQGIPYGAYVQNIRMDSPAMLAGLQPGDIIIKMGAEDIPDMDTLSYHLHHLNEDADIQINIMRQSQGEYKESTLNIKLRKQN